MSLPIPLSYPPMDALLIADLPSEPGWQFEPKWDGFRCLAFRDKDRITLQSKSGKPLTRYFPEVAAAVASLKAPRFILDGEIVIPAGNNISFDALLQRIHPAASRIKKLSEQTPAVLIVFDLLTDEKGRELTGEPMKSRRAKLESFARRYFPTTGGIVLSPATTNRAAAARWLGTAGGALDGVVGKRLEMAYQSGNRHGMVKVKKLRSADCVVGGFRYASGKREVGSLLLGLYNEHGLLDHVGFCSAFTAAARKTLRPLLEPLIKEPGFTGDKPGGPSRWSTAASAQWKPLSPTLVVEVRYDHFTGGRFRHGTRFLRWRPDKAPAQCKRAQVEQESAAIPIKLKFRSRPKDQKRLRPSH